MKTLFYKPEGALVSYDPDQDLLTISDLNPEFTRTWLVTRKELRQLAWALFKVSFSRRYE